MDFMESVIIFLKKSHVHSLWLTPPFVFDFYHSSVIGTQSLLTSTHHIHLDVCAQCSAGKDTLRQNKSSTCSLVLNHKDSILGTESNTVCPLSKHACSLQQKQPGSLGWVC